MESKPEYVHKIGRYSARTKLYAPVEVVLRPEIEPLVREKKVKQLALAMIVGDQVIFASNTVEGLYWQLLKIGRKSTRKSIYNKSNGYPTGEVLLARIS